MTLKGKIIGALILLAAMAGIWLYLIPESLDTQDHLQWRFEGAAYKGNLPEVKRLFGMGAKPNYISHREQNTGSPSALYYAAERGQDEVVQFLIGHGADVDLCYQLGPTPLWAAIENQHYSTAKLLLDAGAKPNDMQGREIDLANWKYGQPLRELLQQHGVKMETN